VSARVEAIDRDPGTIDLVINSHFHFDHIGGNALIRKATMLVQRRAWDAGMEPDTAARCGFNPRDFDLGHKLRPGRWRARRVRRRLGDVPADARAHARAPVAPGETRRR
jgi:glyoxylase-like metal-dependent hydrolase (beta-lactamase superfamily II)